jgi:predicted amidohydrolase YtcJ
MAKRMLCIVAFFVFAGLAEAQDTAPADLVVLNASIHTLDPQQPTAEAIAIRGNKIIAVGTNESIQRLTAASTKKIDAQGRVILPGFNDSHVHFLQGGRQLSSVDLRDAKTPQEFAARIAKYASTQPQGTWITGGDWDHENWPGTPLPTKELIDAGTPDHPVFVNRLDGHMAVANTAALRLAGVTKETPDPDGGFIVRDPASREPTGMLKDAAMSLVARKIPADSFEEKIAAARAATHHAAKLGVTSVQDMSGGRDVLVYEELLRRGELKTRVYAIAPLPQWERSERAGLKAAVGSRWLRQGGLKGFADGSLGSTTALFFEPYADAPQTRGLASDEMFPAGTMQNRVLSADRSGLQVMIHAIGDQANDQILTVFERVTRDHGVRDRRFRIEHAQHLRLSDVARFASGRVIASMQPYHCADDGRWAEKRIGSERAKGTYAFRSLLDAGAILAFGSDWNVAPLDPMQGIAAAVTRRTLDGKHPDGWVPEQKISVEEAVRAYTVGSAFAEFQENAKGTLARGKLADLVMLSHDIFAIDPNQIEKTRVILTVVDGKIVYEDETTN